MPMRARRDRPSGLGLDSADVRRRMAQRLREGGILEPRVLAAFAAVPRHLFVDAALATQAYEDTSLPIGHGQTISKPSVVGRMIELLFGGANARSAREPRRRARDRYRMRISGSAPGGGRRSG